MNLSLLFAALSMLHNPSVLAGRLALTVVLWMAALESRCERSMAQPPKIEIVFPSNASFEQATEIYHNHISQCRQRAGFSMRLLAEEFERAVTTQNADSTTSPLDASQTPAGKIHAFLRSSSEAETACLHILSLKQKLSPALRSKVEEILPRLADVSAEQSAVKSAYRPYFAAHLQRQWKWISIPLRRELLFQYYALSGERPEWLFPVRPPHAPLPLQSESKRILLDLERRNRDITNAHDLEFLHFAKKMVATITNSLEDESLTQSQRAALEALRGRLDADWAQEFRSFMLWDLEPDLPEPIASTMRGKHLELQGELKSLVNQAAVESKPFRKRLEGIAEPQLGRAEFAEPFAIDLRLRELESVIAPLRIRAVRRPGTGIPEEAKLLALEREKYRVRWSVDATESLLPPDQVFLRKSKASHADDRLLLSQPPITNGTPVTKQTRLRRGQRLLGYRDGRWQDVQIIDLSPEGVVLDWAGIGVIDRLEPREILSIVATSPVP